ncbi:MAG: MFS transporter [Firmicutes bacterium]|nr:MFS transporter [Bacillota bacterium]
MTKPGRASLGNIPFHSAREGAKSTRHPNWLSRALSPQPAVTGRGDTLRPWLSLVNILLAAFLTVLNSNMIRVAIPAMATEFSGLKLSWLTWVINGYLLPYSVLMPIFGRLGDMYGRKKVFLAGLLVFTVGSTLCSWNRGFVVLVVFRMLQALGAAAIFPNALVMATGLFPREERGRIVGLWAAVGAFGAVVGPTVGGFLVQYFNWRSIFYINIPIGLLAFTLAWLLLPETGERKDYRGFDYGGAAYLSLAILGLLFFLTIGSERGWVVFPALLSLALGLLGSWLFWQREGKVAEPIIDLSLFRPGPFLAAVLSGVIQMFTGQGTNLLLPLFLTNIQRYSAAQMGLMLFPGALTRIFASPLGGALSDRYGSRWLVAGGMLTRVLTFGLYAFITKDTGYGYFAVLMVVSGLAGGMIQSPLLSSALGSSPAEQMGAATGFFNMSRFIGGLVGTAASGILLSSHLPVLAWNGEGSVPGFREAYLLAAAASLLGALVSLRLPLGGREARENKVSAPAQEQGHVAG